MQSVVSYKERGNFGNSNYRGNCTGYIIKDLINHFYPNSKPKKFVEIFSGGGTGQDVARELNITNSLHLDLNNGWDALTDEIPTGSDFIFSHPHIGILFLMKNKEIYILKMIYLMTFHMRNLFKS